MGLDMAKDFIPKSQPDQGQALKHHALNSK